jgi:hypothetical protein
VLTPTPPAWYLTVERRLHGADGDMPSSYIDEHAAKCAKESSARARRK